MPDAQSNIAKTLEEGIKNALEDVAALRDVWINAFQIPPADDENPAREFPQIALGIGPEVPSGHNSTFYTANGYFIVATHSADTDDKKTLGTFYGALRTAIDTLNTDPDAWRDSYLPSTYVMGGLVVEDSPPPYFDENVNAIEIVFRLEFTVN